MCAFDTEDRTLAWNRSFLRLFPEHAGHVHVGEPYRANLQRFYATRLDAEEREHIERHIAAGIARHQTQYRPFEFEHRGRRIKVSSVPFPPWGRVRIWHGSEPAPAHEAPVLLRVEGSSGAAEHADTSLLDHVPDGLMLCGADGGIRWINETFAAVYGIRDPKAVLGQTFETVYRAAWSSGGEADAERMAQGLAILRRHLRYPGAAFELPLPGEHWSRVIARSVVDGTVFYACVDLTDLKRTEAKLRQSEARYARALRGASDCLWDWNLVTGEDFHSRRFEELLGYAEGELPHTVESFDAILHPDDRARLRSVREVHFRYDLPYQVDHRLRTKSGEYKWFRSRGQAERDASGKVLRMSGAVSDITEQVIANEKLRAAKQEAQSANRALRAANAELARLAAEDRLTGAASRRHFEDRAEREIERARRYGAPLSLVLMDIDRFKSINDRFGHVAGDRVLVEVARRVREQLRAVDVFARWGGEEFAILLPECRVEEAMNMAERLRAMLAGEPIEEVGVVTSSFGVTELGPGESLDDLLTHADRALYAAKNARRNAVRRYG